MGSLLEDAYDEFARIYQVGNDYHNTLSEKEKGKIINEVVEKNNWKEQWDKFLHDYCMQYK